MSTVGEHLAARFGSQMVVGFDAAYFIDTISPWHTWIDAAGLTEEPTRP
jgi:hypothetical protein